MVSMNASHRILIVDDEADSLHLLQQIFHEKDLHVLTAASGTEALEILKKSQVDLIIVDMVMAGINGIDLLNEIRRRGINAKFIVVTAYGEMDSYMKVMNMGAVDYLSKPVNQDQLLEIVSRVVGAGESKEGLQLQE